MRKSICFSFLLMMLIGTVGYANAATISYNVEEGATLEEFDGVFTITIEGTSDVMTDSYSYYNLYRVFDDNTTKLIASNSAMYDSNANVIKVEFPDYNLWPDYPIQTSGNYRIVIPGSAFSIDGTINESKEINFLIDAPEKYITIEDVTIDPAPGKFEEIIPQFTITLPDEVTSVDFNEVAAGSSSYYGTILAKAQFGQIYNGQFVSSAGEYDIEVEGNKLILTPSSTLVPDDLREGEWGIRILRNSMYFNGDKTKYNENLVLGNWVYPKFMSLEFNPESGNKIVDITKFYAIIENVQSTVVVDENVVPKLYLFNDENSNYDYVCDLNTTVTIKESLYGYNNAEVEFTPNTTSTLAYGKYKIEMPKGVVKTTDDDPVLSAPVSVEYEYIEAPNISLVPTWSISEGETVAQFTEVTMVFDEATQIDYVGRYDYSSVISINQVVDGEVTPWGGGQGYLEVEIEGNQVKLYMVEDAFYPYYPIDADGDYRVIVPRGKFAFEGVDTYVNEELVLNFKVDAVEPVITADCASIDPAPSVVKHMAHTFTVTLDGIEGEISVAEVTKSKYDSAIDDYVEYQTPATAELICHTSFGYSYTVGNYDIEVEGNKLILTPDEEMTPDMYWDFADYSIAIAKGILLIDNDPAKTNARLEFGKYTIERVAELAFVEPQQVVVEELSTFKLSSDAYVEPTKIDDTLITIAKLDDVSGGYVVLDNKVTTTAAIDASYKCAFTLTLANTITEPGKYRITIARGAYVWEDYFETYSNAELVGDFEIEAVVDPIVAFTPIAIDPAEGSVKAIKDITITFDNEYFAKGLWCENAVAKIYDQSKAVVASASIEADTKDAKLYISLAEEICAEGTYNVVIEAGVISDYEDENFVNPEISLTYVIEPTGVEAVSMDAKVYTVVTINGMLIKENASWNEVMNLEPGIYVINGEKVYIRK